MIYEDFEIRFSRLDGTVVQSSAHWSGASCNEELRFPLLDRLDGMLTSVAAAVRDADSNPQRDFGRAANAIDPRALGDELFRSLFSGNIRDLYNQSLGRGKPLRIRLSMNLDDEQLTPLASLPWELMYDHERREVLLLGAQKAFVRSPHIPRPLDLPPFKGPLRVLFVMANPHGDLKLNDERIRIESAIAAERADVRMDFLENATRATLGDRLEQNDYHVVHFMGHGTFRSGEGVLLLQDGEFRGSDLATLMRNEPETRLFVLNACRTAEIARVRGQDPFEGVATALLMSGMPAVIAMQFPVSDEAAIAFAGSLYAGMAHGKPIEEAVGAARRKLSRIAAGRHEWATPALFLRSDGNLFTAPSTPRWQGAEQPKLLVYLIDRTELRNPLQAAIAEQRKRSAAPLVGIIHGDDAQCHVELIQRLQRRELPELIGLDARSAITLLSLTWPRDARSADEFQRALTPTLAAQMPKIGSAASSAEEISQALTMLDGPTLIYTYVLITELEASRAWNPIEQYLRYWNRFPAGTASRRILAFLAIKYRAPEEAGPRGWLDRLRPDPATRIARKLAESASHVKAKLTQLAEANGHEHLVLCVLPELDGVTEQDAINWATDHDLLHLERDITDIFREHERRTGSLKLPMQEITDRLKKLLAESNPRRDVA